MLFLLFILDAPTPKRLELGGFNFDRLAQQLVYSESRLFLNQTISLEGTSMQS